MEKKRQGAGEVGRASEDFWPQSQATAGRERSLCHWPQAEQPQAPLSTKSWVRSPSLVVLLLTF